jgi:hypothetical protein
MSERQETIADIIAKKRKYADEIERKAQEYIARSERVPGAYQSGIVYNIRSEADRLEAAHKRERGNSAAMREALKHIKDRLPHMLQYMRVHWEDASAGGYFDELMLVIDAALAAPARNCDVGTAEEQTERFDKFCHANINTQRCCGDCPAFRTTRDDCELVWAQLPYEAKEGGAK